MEEKEIQKYKKELELLAEKALHSNLLEYDSQSEEHKRLMSTYKINAVIGKALYTCLSDEELKAYLRKRSKELGHVPTQKEVYWIYRIYLKQRFGNWPKALRAAVLSSKAGSGGHSYEQIEERERRCEEKLRKIRERADQLHRPPHMAEMKDCVEVLKYKYDTWDQVLLAAGIDQIWKNQHMLFKVEDLSPEETAFLDAIKAKVEELGRAPLRKEIDQSIFEALKLKCKTWRNILYQIGLVPVEKQKSFSTTYLDGGRNKKKLHREVLCDGVYKVVKPTEKEKAYLGELKKIIKELKRSPIKEELPPELYTTLMELCGSYKNLLYQVNAEPLEKSEAQRLKRKLKAQKN